ncbi:phosphate ABC transporter substrate-binding protein [Nitrospina gracilis]|uniref:phosphate ABC transporter substrate-binding protein n=1 Tax=Nitrospina gracilis TaxID=35801 RepID=UPI001F1921A4|nr:phosphate ABC transporter substrate-binding protein [Nitrospina gracilis]MCF8719824.1 phosphate transport system substrate-binding protein [Nitrospina gracilis Nb-211]
MKPERSQKKAGSRSLRVFAGMLAVFFTATTSPQAQETTLIRVGGSTTVLPIVTVAAERYQQLHPEVRITVNAGGSGVGIHGIGSGRLDIGMASRSITRDEMERYAGSKLRTHVVGRDAVACVISSEVYKAGVTSLSRDQIASIYRGRITNWKEVGGPDRPIIVIDKEPHRGTRHVFMRFVFGDEKARAPGARLVTGSNNEEQVKVAQSDAAIGMLSLAWINDDVAGVGIRMEGRVIAPTLENVRNGSFPIARDLNLITAGPPEGAVKAFIDYLLGPEGQVIVQESGYIPVNGPVPVN